MRNDEEYLQDILSACHAIQMFSSGLDRDIFASTDSVSSSVLWKLMIIGEAATRISDELKARHVSIEWNAMRGFRNILVHAYFKINHDLVWDAIQNRIEPLQLAIRKIVEAEFSSSGSNPN
ncbi:MAG: HepT-like ribonuclease domain-containing protein [Blastocatellia bacterium]